jgi:hypothetical protein
LKKRELYQRSRNYGWKELKLRPKRIKSVRNMN